MNQYPIVTNLDEALERVAEFLTSPATREHIDRAIGNSLAVAYEVEIRHHPTKGLLVSVRYHKGQSGQVFYLGNIDGPSPDNSNYRD
jgi:hypothetical protein